METLESKKDYLGETEYITRELNFNNKNFLIIEEGYSYKSMCFCLANEEYAYYLKVRVREDGYKAQIINTINDIFSTYIVYLKTIEIKEKMENCSVTIDVKQKII